MDAITSAVPDTAGPPDATPEHEVLAALRPLGEELKAWRYHRAPVAGVDPKAKRAQIRARIRPILERGREAGFTRDELAEALGVVIQTVDNIRNDIPDGRWANSGNGASLTPELRDQFRTLGHKLAEWRYVHSDLGKSKRAQVRAEIRELANSSPEATGADIAKALMITPQQFYAGIMNDNPTGRSR